MLVRGALCRLTADVPKTSAHDLPQLARFLQRALLARNASKLPAVRALSRAYVSALDLRRSYATTTRATATKPTAAVKKAVKAKAVKKAAPKKKAASVTVKKPKKKKVVSKTAAPKKAAPKKRVKKVLTPEEQEKATISKLRKQALKEPFPLGALTGFNAYIAEICGGPIKGQSRGDATRNVTDAAKNWKNLTPAEHEHYNHLANDKNVARQAELRAWIHSYTPEEIRIANNARAALRRKLAGTPTKRKYPAHTSKLHDDRHVKKPASAYLLFNLDRYASGDLKGIKTTDAAKLVGNEWKALSAGEKKKYEDEAKAKKEKAARKTVAAST
ncbi:uncharacterized protein K460DRAFT_347492 [Cucurbitaria berberidis CBS 394.84]|uniref:HMG box domain-containing protein n=1 Tax=Cucurbitaria berberidis CBS 394.84 TaxID=1168544 RepID=A0A9P4L3J1_9PLEO|nr:uncharacterized protein K460DRAFT_347492 [Cucurbitaria berberidis CBS 394.84]KAF1840981.1 hypothetical protein K460DRAFT_347492 [Cucurbitaria berberidis CBS 394.84]